LNTINLQTILYNAAMRTTAMAGRLLVTFLAATAPYGLGQQTPKPSVINSTYFITDDIGRLAPITKTFRLKEEDGMLTYSEDGGKGAVEVSVEYAKVLRVARLVSPVPIPGSRNLILVRIEDSEGHVLFVRVTTASEADALSEYVGRRAGLELIADVWRVRKPFQCPEPAPIGCLDFKELLDHDDPEIVGYFYHLNQANLQTFACFRSDEQRFFILQYYVPYLQSSESRFFHKVFKNGQENSSTLVHLRWRGDVGEITDSIQQKGTRQTLGWIDSSSLSFHNKFTNKQQTTTNYTLNIRWSTGRYTENYSWKDDKGKTFVTDSSGICVKLN
jgi:hypothetical protein